LTNTGDSVNAGGSASSFGNSFANNADGTPNTGAGVVQFATNTSSVNTSSSITVIPAVNVNVAGNVIGDGSADADTNAEVTQDVVNANADAIEDGTDELTEQAVDNLNNVNANGDDTASTSTANGETNVGQLVNEITDEVVASVVVPSGSPLESPSSAPSESVVDTIDTGNVSGEVDTTTTVDDTQVVGSGLGSAVGDATGSVVENFQDDTSLDRISNIQAAPDQNSIFDMNVPGFIGDIFNGIDFQEFLDSLPQQFAVMANFNQGAEFGGILQADESGSPGGFLYNLFYQNWVEETLFDDVLTCPAVENEPECVVNSQGDTGRWTCRTLFHPVSGTPKSFSTCGTSRRTLGSDQCGCCGGVCPTACTCPCNLRGRGEGTGVLVRVGATLDSCMSPASALKFTERNPGSFQCIDECRSV
jgi:hypothetical protein